MRSFLVGLTALLILSPAYGQADSTSKALKDVREEIERFELQLEATKAILDSLYGVRTRLEARIYEETQHLRETKPEPSSPAADFSFSGTGFYETRKFTVDGPWTIEWECDRQMLTLNVGTDDGMLKDIITPQGRERQAGSYRITEGGTYYLVVRGFGHSTITVTDQE